jgi:hypothetical protein
MYPGATPYYWNQITFYHLGATIFRHGEKSLKSNFAMLICFILQASSRQARPAGSFLTTVAAKFVTDSAQTGPGLRGCGSNSGQALCVYP